jgi:uncharacterized protein
MEKTPLTRSFLETLSSADLVALADENGIDIPEGLNRRFIIGELLELAEDNRFDESEPTGLVDAEYTLTSEVLPETYNETQISALLRDPGWIFVYWDFHTTLFTALTGNHRFESFFLRVNALSSTNPMTIVDFFDVEVGTHDRKWYVHLPGRSYACRIELYSRNTQEQEQLLARSREIVIPQGGVTESPFESRQKNPPLVELSGLAELRKSHFRNHRQSFN